MVDFFSLALTHALMVVAAWRLLMCDGVDRDPASRDLDSAAEAASSDPFKVPRIELRHGRSRAGQPGRKSGHDHA